MNPLERNQFVSDLIMSTQECGGTFKTDDRGNIRLEFPEIGPIEVTPPQEGSKAWLVSGTYRWTLPPRKIHMVERILAFRLELYRFEHNLFCL